MITTGSWFVNEMKGKIPKDFDLGTFNFPVFEDGVGDPDALRIFSTYYFITTNRYPRQTVDFFRYLTSRERATAFSKMLDSPTAIRGVPDTVYGPLMHDVVRMVEQSKTSFGNPPGSIGYAIKMDQPMTDARYKLLMGQITPEQYGDMLEKAAEEVRTEIANPDLLRIRHPWAGSALLMTVVGILVYALYTQYRQAQRRKIFSGTTSTLRMNWCNAIIFVGPALLLYLLFVVKPGVEAFGWALTHWDGITERRFAGLVHFKKLLFGWH